jgi:cystathionine beta-lyase/cystathionine gamma-synthase
MAANCRFCQLKQSSMDYDYIINHLGEDREKYFGAVAPPIMQTSNFSFGTVEEMRQALMDEQANHLYTRGNNPTVEVLRKKLAALAGAEDALVFGSGMAAISSALLSNVKAGDHVLCMLHPYSWIKRLVGIILPQFGIEGQFVDATNIDAVKAAIKVNTTVIILESPNTFTFEVQDIRAIVAIAKERGITTMIDNTYSTMLGQRCIELGIDIELHSASKYISGHSDVVAGVAIGSKEHIANIYKKGFMNLGGIISPNDAWLLLRGLRTLKLRLKHIAENTQRVVDFMEAQPQVARVLYPFSTSFAQYELAKEQMQWCGGLFSVLLNTDDVDVIERFCNELKYFQLAVSWGGHESLVIPACAALPKNAYRSHVPRNLVRLYCGLEDAETLMGDLKNALQYVV